VIADDLFAGAGGWDVAARWLGLAARGVENMPAARATRAAADLETVHDDVWTYRPDGSARIMLDSPPCQTFSQAGSGSGRRALNDVLALIPFVADMSLEQLRDAGVHLGDERTALVLTPLWFALHSAYEHLAWEQVPAVLPVWEACAAELRSHGWNVWTGNLSSECYGVPQTRRRAVLIGSRTSAVGPPTPTHSRYHNRTPERLDPGVPPWVSMERALGWGGFTVVSNYGSGGDPANRGQRSSSEPAATVTSKVDRNRLDWQLASGTRAKAATRPIDNPAPTLAFGHDAASYVWTPAGMTPAEVVEWKAARLNNQSGTDFDIPTQLAQPASSITGRGLVPLRGANANRHNGSSKSRNDGIRISVQEAGVLQSFPADFPWQGTLSDQYKQVGNAIPPLMAMAILTVLFPERAIL